MGRKDYRHRSSSPKSYNEDRKRNRRSTSRDLREGSSSKKTERTDATYSTSLSREHSHRDHKRKRDKSEERRARKAEKKRLKEEDEARQVAELSIYSATDNPFHDVNLGQQFRWHKKIEKDKKQGLSLAESERRDAIRRQEAVEELERLNKRRAEREAEMRLREEEEIRMQRLAESSQMAEWLSKDGEFQLEQERRRASIRLKEKRARAVDFLVLNLTYINPSEEVEGGLGIDEVGLEIDLDEPYTILESLNIEQAEELHEDIERYLSLEFSDINIDFWTNMMVVCKDWLEKLRSRRDNNRDATAAVERDVSTILGGKTPEQLSQLQRQIQAKLSSGEPVDTDYWEGLLKHLLVWKAKAKLKLLHEVVVRNRLEQLRKRQRDEALLAQEELLAGVASSISKPVVLQSEVVQKTLVEEDSIPYDRAMSPIPLDIKLLERGDQQVSWIDEAKDRELLLDARRSVANTRFVAKQEQTTSQVNDNVETQVAELDAEALYRAEAEKELEEEEELFNLEETIQNPTTYNWEDKYRPRKPRYFNRVHTGYEWNKYNQTHYDTDNPPPKVVQGYKFNIFYPDLIDKTKAPTYRIVKEPGNDETVLLYFTAGPPYEDIAFRIVNRDWEYSHKRGFRSSFDRGCLSLWFNFRRNFYRK